MRCTTAATDLPGRQIPTTPAAPFQKGEARPGAVERDPGAQRRSSAMSAKGLEACRIGDAPGPTCRAETASGGGADGPAGQEGAADDENHTHQGEGLDVVVLEDHP